MIQKNRTVVIDELVEFWNKLKLRKHRPGSQSYKTASLYFSFMKKGELERNFFFESDFLEKNNIPQETLSKKFLDKEIKLALRRIPLFYKRGYWPRENMKRCIPKDLDKLIYNERSLMRSYFLIAFVRKPSKLYSEQSDYTKQDLNLMSHFSSILEKSINDLSPKEKYILFKIAKELILIHSRIKLDKLDLTKRIVIRSSNDFINHYVAYLEEQNKQFSPFQITINSFYFKNFIYSLNNDFFIDLRYLL